MSRMGQGVRTGLGHGGITCVVVPEAILVKANAGFN